MKTKDFKSGTKMTKSTSVVPKAEQWGRVYDRGKKHFKGFCIPEEISRIKERVVKGLFTNEKYLER